MVIPPYLQNALENGFPEDTVSQFSVDSIIALTVISSNYPAGSEFIAINDYNITSYANRSLEIQIDFANPSYISVDALDKDWLEIKFIKPWFFKDITGHELSKTERLRRLGGAVTWAENQIPVIYYELDR